MERRPLSSTTEQPTLHNAQVHSGERGQVLAIFAGGLVAIIAIAALVFDTGQSLLDRRTQQNAADAAALAGARHIPSNPGNFQGVCDPLPTFLPAQRACEVAIANGFVHGVNSTVEVKIPPGPESVFSNLPGYIQVQIGSTRSSFFSGVLGLTTHTTGALGVARNAAANSLPYSLLSLNPSGCGVTKITGSPGSSVAVNGAIHVDSNCASALLVSGNGAVDAPTCDIVGAMQTSGGGRNGCLLYNPGVQVSGDPLRDLPAPPVPSVLGRFEKITTRNPPASCPNGGAVTEAVRNNPQTCTFGGAFNGHVYRMYPGYYPGGLQLNAGTFYMEPGIYWIAGGGWSMNGGNLIAVASGTTTPGGGVLIYNSEESTFSTECAANPGFNAGCFGSLSWQGGGVTINVRAITTTRYAGMVMFQDRRNAQPLSINGASSNLTVSGTIYAPAALVSVNGSSSAAVAAQIISYDFQVNGSGGALAITYESGGLFKLEGVGLVE